MKRQGIVEVGVLALAASALRCGGSTGADATGGSAGTGSGGSGSVAACVQDFTPSGASEACKACLAAECGQQAASYCSAPGSDLASCLALHCASACSGPAGHC